VDFGLRIVVFDADTDSDPNPDFQRQYGTQNAAMDGMRVGIRLCVAIKSKDT
jgi:hypothetical protein